MLNLQNQHLHVVVNEDRGSRLESFKDVRLDKEWVWQPEPQPGQRPDAQLLLDIGSPFERYGLGGWNDIFPNSEPLFFRHRHLADHGELWSQRWEVLSHTALSATLRRSCQTVPVVVEKQLSLAPDLAELELRWEFHNRGHEAIPYLFKFQPALRIERGDEFILPRCELNPIDLGFSTMAEEAGPTEFPYIKKRTGRLSPIHKVADFSAHAKEALLCRSLSAGYAGLHNHRTATRLSFHFKRQEFAYLSWFQSLGGYKGHYMAMLQPCTNPVASLAAAALHNQAAILPPAGQAVFIILARLQPLSLQP